MLVWESWGVLSGLGAGFLIGVITTLWLTRDARARQQECAQLRERLAALEAVRAEEQRSFREKLNFAQESEARTSTAFKGLSLEALQSNSRTFLELAQNALNGFQTCTKHDFERNHTNLQQLLSPLQNHLQTFEKRIQELEKQREGAYGSLTEQLKNLMSAQVRLENETASLSSALRDPNIRGHWGEMQLRRAVELAGMLPYIDFEEQVNLTGEERRQRPDMVIHLPNGRDIIVDAKTPSFQSYLAALQAKEETIRDAHLQEHARQIKENLIKLGTKEYHRMLPCTPEFVVLFLPSEVILSAALKADPQLIDFSAQNNVILATPTILIALLKAVAYGWRQEEIAKEAKHISALGSELYERIAVFAEHFNNIRNGLLRANESYNKALSSLESRILVTARRLREKHITCDREIQEPAPIETIPSNTSSGPA